MVHIHNHDLRAHDNRLKAMAASIATASCEVTECATANIVECYRASLSGAIDHLRHALSLAEEIQRDTAPKVVPIPLPKREPSAAAQNMGLLTELFDRIRKEAGAS